MRLEGVLAALAAGMLWPALFATSAVAEPVTFCPPGSGAAQCEKPQGVAVDSESARVYVADRGNNRIDVFDTDGTFRMAFGWGVADGTTNALQSCGPQASPPTVACFKGIPGAGNGQFSGPAWVAVDNNGASTSHHDIYVGTDNSRVQKFSPEGELLPISIVAEDECLLSRSGDPLAVGPGGALYVGDYASGTDTNRIDKFDPETGACIEAVKLFEGAGTSVRDLAVDSGGDVYVTIAGAGGELRKYGPGGELLKKLDEGFETNGLTIDGADDVFAQQREPNGLIRVITEYDSSGKRLHRFGYGTVKRSMEGLAFYPSAEGDVVGSEEEFGISDFKLPVDNRPEIPPTPCEANPIGNTKATLNAQVNPEGKATTFHFEYVTQEHFDEEGFAHPQETAVSSIEQDFVLNKVSSQASVVPETEYRCRVTATNSDGSATGEEGSFKTPPPFECGTGWSSEVGNDAATLSQEGNPEEILATGVFEYVEEVKFQESGFAEAVEAPEEEEINLGEGNAMVRASVGLSGLQPATRYHFRLRAKDSFVEIHCEEHTFRTLPPAEGALPDTRAYELVSPGEKNSAEVAVPGIAGGLFDEERSLRIEAAAGSGEAMTYTSWTSFGEGAGAQGASQYLSKRGGDGWTTENISPFGVENNALRLPYRGFSVDLRFAGVVVSEPACAEGAVGGVESLCLRDDETGELKPLTSEAPVVDPGELQPYCTAYGGATADGKEAVFAANGAMAGAPVGPGFSIYEWSEDAPLALVSVLPDGTPAPPATDTAVGAGRGFCGMDQQVVSHAISKDGSVVFWTYGGKYVNSGGKTIERPLFARTDGKETIELDAQEKGTAAGGNGIFWGASADGSKALLSAPGKLVKGAGADDLYRYDFEKPAAERLTDLTANPEKIPAEIEGVIGASEDEAYVYFVAHGALSGEEENAAGQQAKEGANNLYLYHEGEGIRFIGALSNLDEGAWSSLPAVHSARVSPDGHELAFTSVEAETLTASNGPGSGYDNLVAVGNGCRLGDAGALVGDPRCAEAFLYEAEANRLSCVSCNPTGARPAGPTLLPTWSNPFEGPRYLSEQGARLFFESRDSLYPGDENEKRDVYEFERPGTGTCSAQSSVFDPLNGGCLFLLSNGKSGDESYLLDASADGRDVFFSTRQALLPGRDTSENYDIYDAREGGGFPETEAPVICEGEGCKPPPTPSPPAPAPATPGFQGPGNAKPKKPKHGKRHHKHNRHRSSGR